VDYILDRIADRAPTMPLWVCGIGVPMFLLFGPANFAGRILSLLPL